MRHPVRKMVLGLGIIAGSVGLWFGAATGVSAMADPSPHPPAPAPAAAVCIDMSTGTAGHSAC